MKLPSYDMIVENMIKYYDYPAWTILYRPGHNKQHHKQNIKKISSP